MGKIKEQVAKKMNDQQRIEFAKQIENMYEATQVSRKRVFGMAVLKGIGSGLGIFLGGTLVVALLLWLLSLGSRVPFVGKISQGAETSIQQTKDSKRTNE